MKSFLYSFLILNIYSVYAADFSSSQVMGATVISGIFAGLCFAGKKHCAAVCSARTVVQEVSNALIMRLKFDGCTPAQIRDQIRKLSESSTLDHQLLATAYSAFPLDARLTKSRQNLADNCLNSSETVDVHRNIDALSLELKRRAILLDNLSKERLV